MKLSAIALFFLSGLFMNANAQELISPSFTFSHKKTCYVTLSDGKELKGTIDDIDRKKGLIETVKVVDESGKTQKLKAEAIKFMYLPPSGLDNLAKATEFMTNVQKWNDEKLNQDLLNQGYAYFENSKVKIKNKEMVLLMQVLNPTFSKKVKVYHDPLAKETMSVGVGGLTVAGGDAKSYFIKVGDVPAYKLEKKNYEKEFVKLWGSCPKLKDSKEKKWSQLPKHVVEYTEYAQQ